MLPRFQVSRAAEEQVLHCFSGLRTKFAKFSFQKYLRRPAVTGRGPSHPQRRRPTVTLAPWPESLAVFDGGEQMLVEGSRLR